MTKIDPRCRYEHGFMEKVRGTYVLPEMRVPVPVKEMHSITTKLLTHFPTGQGFAALLYKCPVCGYLELFDAPPPAE